MITPQALVGSVRAEPFRPFRISRGSGRVFDVRHPEMIKVLKSHALVFQHDGEIPDFPEAWDTVSLMLTESVSHLEAPVR